MKRTLALAGVMLASAGVVIATPASADVHTPCSVESIVNTRVAQLGASVPWSVGTVLRKDAQAVTYTDEVVVSRETACDYDLVTSIVNHEWVHTQQHVFAGHKLLRKVFGSEQEVERIADCGSKLLGSRYTPYLDMWGPCTDTELSVARNLIELPAHVAV